MKRSATILSTILLSISLTLLCSIGASAQSRGKLKKENSSLKAQLDSLRMELETIQKEAHDRDSIAQEMLSIFQENEGKRGIALNPDDFSADVTDSLLNLWYIHRQVNGNENFIEMFDMDSVHFTSNVPDAVLKQRLEKMNSYITLPYNDIVRNYMILYSEKMPTRMNNIMALCQYYMPIFEETFRKYDIPDELKYVAIIESALNPTAVSRAGARGMWQFMIKTAKSYGLEVNSYVDERQDPFKSADAAARYMVDSYKLFGDWNLAISSYNCGPGNVNKAIRRSGSRNFWNVFPYLPRETRGYVPAFVGAMYALKYSKEYGLAASGIQMPAQVDTFQIHKNLHFGQISELVGISVDELRNLNPQYIKDVIPGDSKTYILRIPYNYTSSFIANEDSLYTYKASEYLNPQTLLESSTAKSTSSSGGTERVAYKVKKGDSLGKVAAKYHVSVNQLKSWNHLRSNTISIGQTLYIYKSRPASSVQPAKPATPAVQKPAETTATEAPAEKAVEEKPAEAPVKQDIVYVVKKGDTLTKIANRYPGVTINDIKSYNKIGDMIREGQKIKIPNK